MSRTSGARAVAGQVARLHRLNPPPARSRTNSRNRPKKHYYAVKMPVNGEVYGHFRFNMTQAMWRESSMANERDAGKSFLLLFFKKEVLSLSFSFIRRD
jgi:hypothetical protein